MCRLGGSAVRLQHPLLVDFTRTGRLLWSHLMSLQHSAHEVLNVLFPKRSAVPGQNVLVCSGDNSQVHLQEYLRNCKSQREQKLFSPSFRFISLSACCAGKVTKGRCRYAEASDTCRIYSSSLSEGHRAFTQPESSPAATYWIRT